MNIPFLASLIAAMLLFSITVKHQGKRSLKQDEEFWQRERQSNLVRRKPLDDLNYIQIPLETFPTHLLQDNPAVLECISIVESLTSQKVVNLTGYSNTDLKLAYGAPNILKLSEFDQNCTVLMRTLQKWADILLENNYAREASVLMAFAIQAGTDIGSTYYRLADYYLSQKEFDKLDNLIHRAENLASHQKDSILKHLREKYPPIYS